METFDYIILTEDNKWVSTGKGETQESLDQEIENVQHRFGEDVNLFVVKAPKLEFISI